MAKPLPDYITPTTIDDLQAFTVMSPNRETTLGYVYTREDALILAHGREMKDALERIKNIANAFLNVPAHDMATGLDDILSEAASILEKTS